MSVYQKLLKMRHIYWKQGVDTVSVHVHHILKHLYTATDHNTIQKNLTAHVCVHACITTFILFFIPS